MFLSNVRVQAERTLSAAGQLVVGKGFAGGVGTGQAVHSCREAKAETKAQSTKRADKSIEGC